MLAAVMAAMILTGADTSSSLEILAGGVFPQGLGHELSASPIIGLRLECPHAGKWRAHVLGQGSYLVADQSPVSLVSAMGGVGLGWKPSQAWPQAGAGLSLTYIREARRHRDPGRYLFFSDGESEFGFYPFFSWAIPLGSHWTLALLGRWDMQFTERRWTHLPTAQIGVGRVLRWKGPF